SAGGISAGGISDGSDSAGSMPAGSSSASGYPAGSVPAGGENLLVALNLLIIGDLASPVDKKQSSKIQVW
nr:hypothetical protein [Tanacetum cinerariifolium]